MSPRLAIVFCVHHKPWLMMGTLLTLASQAPQDADLFFAYNVGLTLYESTQYHVDEP